MVEKMKQMCNKHAEKAGYGEKVSGGTSCLVHFFCDKVRGPKLQKPTATSEEIYSYLLPRCSRPLQLKRRFNG
jgi:hypothetical protein